MSDRYVVNFVGRFVFVCDGTAGEVSRVAAVALNMRFNDDLPSRPHRVLLTARRMDVQPIGIRAADLTLFIPSDDASREQDQLLVWNLDGHDGVPGGSSATGFQFENWERMPDIRALAGKDAPTLGTVRKELVDPEWHVPPGSLVNARFFFTSGVVAAHEFNHTKVVSFEPLGQGEPHDPDPKEPLPDVGVVRFSLESPPRLLLTRHGDLAKSSLTLVPRKDGKDVTVTISNLCACGGPDDDVEFAAYYDVLKDPPPARQRRIPYVKRQPRLGPRADCTGVAKALVVSGS